MQELADLWLISQPRVSQIVHDTYNEQAALYGV
jgi:hypothetical protein